MAQDRHRRQPGAPVIERPRQPLLNKSVGSFPAHTADRPQHRQRRGFPRCGRHPVALGLHCLDLFEKQLEPVEFAANARPEMRWQRLTFACSQFVKARTPVPTRRLVIPQTNPEVQALDTVDVTFALLDQRLAFAIDPARILIIDRRHTHLGKDPWLPPHPRQQRPDQDFTINAVGLCRPVSA